MEDQEIKAKILNRLFEQYAGENQTYLHSEFIHHDVESPKVVIPIIRELFDIRSVVDVGCGLAAWLKVFQDSGVQKILGIDGEYVKNRKLLIEKKYMTYFNLEELNLTFPEIEGRFDLAVCLEVAEHLKPEIAEDLVRFLTSLSDVVLFSAAVPFQGGINHINEQWPEYWQNLFKKYGYVFHDVVRPKIWDNANVKWWYKQNAFLVVKEGFLDLPELKIKNYIHPELFLQHMIATKK